MYEPKISFSEGIECIRKKCFYCDFRTLIKLSEIVKYNSSSFTEELLERVEKGCAHRNK